MACAICQIRRPRRFCPGVRGDICALCCGTEREVSVDCPLDCEYLQEARKHEKPQPLSDGGLPNLELMPSREVLDENEPLLSFLAQRLLQAALGNPGVIDHDVREALEASIRTHRTLQTGLVYETLPSNPLAAGLCRALETAIEEFRREEAERLGIHKTRESAILGVLVFFQHFEISYNNGRKRGRAFLQALLDFYPLEAAPEASGTSSLLLP